MKLSVIVPVFNEAATVQTVVKEIEATGFHTQIIIVDDASTDGSREIIEGLKKTNITVLFHEVNKGKGAAVRSALSFADGDIVIIQDADLEYHPDEYSRLIDPIIKGRADAVFGSRFIGAHRCFLFSHYIGNKIVNLIANILYNTMLTDFMTCYKAFRRETLRSIRISSSRFGVEAEITGELFRRGWRVYEVPISYSGRDYKEGKKIKWTDFFVVLLWLWKTKWRTLPQEGSRYAARKENSHTDTDAPA